MQHASGHRLQGYVLPLRYSILLQSVRYCVLRLYTFLWEKMLDISVHIFPPIVCAKDFDIYPGLSLCMFFEVFQMLKNLWLLPEKIQPSVSWEIINKCNHVACFVDGWTRKGSHQIIVDGIQRRGGPMDLPFLKLLLGMFSKNASLKNSFGEIYVEQVSDHILFS